MSYTDAMHVEARRLAAQSKDRTDTEGFLARAYLALHTEPVLWGPPSQQPGGQPYSKGVSTNVAPCAAPAEVAEGAEDLIKRLEDASSAIPGLDVQLTPETAQMYELFTEAAAALRAAPSLSREEARLLDSFIINSGELLGPPCARRDAIVALLAKVREAGKS